MRDFKLMFRVLLLLLVPLAVQAEPLPAQLEQQIRQNLQKLQPDMSIDSISKAPIAGLYQVELGWEQGKQFIYTTAQGDYLLQGNLYRVQGDDVTNLTQQTQSQAVRQELLSVKDDETVMFSPAAPKTVISVFTDTSCPYCQRLHQEVAELNRQGVAVRYLAYPRAGLDSSTFKVLQSVWCADDRQDAMTRAKADEKVTQHVCASPVARQYALGQKIGIRGTPAIVLANGQVIPGYQPANILAAAALEAEKQRAATN